MLPTFSFHFTVWGLLFSLTRTNASVHKQSLDILVDVSYVVAEVTNCKQGDVEFRGHEEIFAEHGGVMDVEEDWSCPKR